MKHIAAVLVLLTLAGCHLNDLVGSPDGGTAGGGSSGGGSGTGGGGSGGGGGGGNPNRVAGLVFAVQPSSSRANAPITPAVQVKVVDEQGAPLTTYTGPLTIDVSPNLLGGNVYGTLTVTAVNGVATFNNLRMDRIGLDYRLTAALAGEASGTESAAFAVTP